MQTSESIHPNKNNADTKLNNDWSIGSIVSVKHAGDNRFLFQAENATIMVQPVNEDIVRVKLLLHHTEDFSTTIAIEQAAFQSVNSTLEEHAEYYQLLLPKLNVVVHKATANIDFYHADGELITKEEGVYSPSRGTYVCKKHMDKHSHIYGLGEKTGFLDKKGEKYDMWNSDVFDPHVPEIECLYVSIPFLIHFQYEKPSYGIFLDNAGRTSFDMRSHRNAYTFQVNSGTIDYYFIAGPTLQNVIQNYSELTGRMELPPAWAIGYHQSRYSYMNQEEVLQLAHSFKEKNIPCDVIHLDIHYMDEYRVFTFDPIRFPNPRQMIDELKELGIRIVPIVDPGVKKDPEYIQYQEGISNQYFCKKIEGELFIGDVWPGASAFPDFTEEEVRLWWGDQHRYYTDLGIAGIWNDMNEPAVFNTTKTMDLDVVHSNDGNPKTHRELHNLYGMLMSMATQQGLKKHLDGERPFVLTRAGYAGVQKYAATWTGDNRSFWEHLAMSIPMVLNLGLSGQPFAGPDIGGFAHHTTPELLARWTQAGVFFPYCRNHSVLDSIRQEPWAFGEEIEDICRKYIRLRYQLMPYLYTLFYSAHKTGMPIMRPLILEYPNDHHVYNLCDQFLVGSSLLVAPILRPSTETRVVYLPEGEWIDYWTGEQHAGGKYILAYAPLDVLPIYVKAGAMIPEFKDDVWKPTLGQQSDISLVLYGGKTGSTSSNSWYEDDAATYAYEQGDYSLLETVASFSEHSTKLAFTYHCKQRSIVREQLNVAIKQLSFVPTQVMVREQEQVVALEEAGGSWSFDTATSELSLHIPNTFQMLELNIMA